NQLTEDPSNSRQKDLVFVKSFAYVTKVSIPGVERPWLSKSEGFIWPNHNTSRILPAESLMNVTDSSIAVSDSSVTDYDSANESSVCSIPLPPLEKLAAAEHVSGPKTIKNSSPAGKLKNGKSEDDIPLSVVLKELNDLKLQINKNQSSYLRNNKPQHCGFNDHQSDDCVNYPTCEKCGSYDHDTKGYNRIISLRRGIKPRNPQQVIKSFETYGSNVHTTTDHNDNEWFRRGEALQAKKVESSNATKSKTPTKRKPIWYLDSGCSRHMTGLKGYLHKYVEQSGPKVVFGDDSTCTTEEYGSLKCNGIFDEKKGIIFNPKKEVVMIYPQVRDVYVLDLTSSAQQSCFFAKATESLNWLWHKILAHLNFKTINQLVKQNLVIGIPSLVYSKDKPCPSCEEGKHHRATFKTKQTSSIKKYLHLLHMDLFGPVTPGSINHEKYTLVIVDEYSRYTWVYFLKKKSHAPETIISFIKRVENQNDIKVKQLKTDNVFIHNKDHLRKFDEKDDDGDFLGYSLVSKAFKVFNTRRQQTKETYHITFNESTKGDTLEPNIILIPTDPSLCISSIASLAPRDTWSKDKHIELVNIIGNQGAEMLTRAMAKELSAASSHECLFVDFLSEE
ncbi:retrovirus-related pol polyprotein from transposon TNT 1-94, partial [Tanacetum coccineum]